MQQLEDIIIGNKTLERILEDHMHWINRDCENWINMRANLSGVKLSGTHLKGVDLRDAHLRRIDLSGADLRCTNLSGAYLSCANLSGAHLDRANLTGAYLMGANLEGTNLEGADLRGAKLDYANLRDADLGYANLHGANLEYANLEYTDLWAANLEHSILYGVNLEGARLEECNLWGANLKESNLDRTKLTCANLVKADLKGAKGNLIKYRNGKILTEDIIGYKKCQHGIIVTLLIPRGSIVFCINGNKCRTNKAKVIAIDGADRAYSRYNQMSYYIGDEFTIYNFDCHYNVECGEGIHFFMTREEAEKY